MNPLAVPVMVLELGLGVTEATAPPGGGAPLRAADRFDGVILRCGERGRLDPSLIKAVIAAESEFRPAAVSPRGARGLMQVMPDTAREMGVPPPLLGEPAPNIRAGAAYLAWLARAARARYGLGPGRLQDAPPWLRRRVLAAYHGGPRLLYMDAWPASTRRYVGAVERLAASPSNALRAPLYQAPVPARP